MPNLFHLTDTSKCERCEKDFEWESYFVKPGTIGVTPVFSYDKNKSRADFRYEKNKILFFSAVCPHCRQKVTVQHTYE